MENESEVIIIGGGPAGLTSGLYLARAGLDARLLEEKMPGGQASLTALIENYPGFPDGISGMELVQKMQQQAQAAGLTINNFTGVSRISSIDSKKAVEAGSSTFETKAIIIATGVTPKGLGVPGEEEFIGRGISFCATCDGPLFKDKDVMVIGGGNAAAEEALHLTQHARKVIVVHRRDKLRAAKVLQDRVLEDPKIEVLWSSILKEIRGDQSVKSAVIQNKETGEESEIAVSGVFLYVGNKPNSEFVKELLETDDQGFIITDDRLETSIPGIFAAGDVRANQLKQLAVAVGDGAVAAVSVQRYLGDRYV